ncbi:hypothetical protein VUR80DRAFT_3925 [Thermomyces stellatus]
MENSLDVTTITTLQLLESRLLHLEQMVYGISPTDPPTSNEVSVARQLENLERRFRALLSRVRVYNDIHKIHKAQPKLFDEPKASEPPSDLPYEALRSIVLASASSFPATESALRAINDCPVPDPAQSAALISQVERMKAIETTQIAQAAEMAELRTRSEEVIRRWYEGNALGASEFIAEVESRVTGVERAVRRAERMRAEAQEL